MCIARSLGHLPHSIYAGIMNTVYLTSSILECVDRELVCEQKAVKVCNLDPSMGTTILLLSILTSAMMLGYKIARIAALAFAHRFFGLDSSPIDV